MQVVEERLPGRPALGRGEGEVDHLLLPLEREPERDQHRAPQGATAGPAAQDHAVEDQHPVVVGERPAVEGLDRLVQHPRHPAHGGRAHPLAEQRQQGLPDLARGQAEDEAGQDHPVHGLLPARVAAQHLDPAGSAAARHAQLDRPQGGQQPAPVVAVAPVLDPAGRQLGDPVAEQAVHAVLEDLPDRLATGRPGVPPVPTLDFHSLEHPGRLPHTADSRELLHGGTSLKWLVLLLEYPLPLA